VSHLAAPSTWQAAPPPSCLAHLPDTQSSPFAHGISPSHEAPTPPGLTHLLVSPSQMRPGAHLAAVQLAPSAARGWHVPQASVPIV
jgi:hypothetical protein